MLRINVKVGISVLLVLVVAAALLALKLIHTSPVSLTQPKLESSFAKQADGSQKLCSAYANICITYPSTWKRTKILNGSNFYGETSPGGVEINPPNGTIVTFAKASAATTTSCKGSSVCHINVENLRKLGSSFILMATFESVDKATGSDRYSPFIALVSNATLVRYGLSADNIGKVVQVSSFNPVFKIDGGSSSELLATPGNDYGPTSSINWLKSTDAADIQAVFLKNIVARDGATL